MENIGKSNPVAQNDGKSEGELQQLESSHLSTDSSHHGRSSRSPQPPRTTYTGALRPTLATRPIAPAPIQPVTALNLQSTVSPAQTFISKSACHPSAPIPTMTVPVSSGTMASIIRPTHPTQGSMNPAHIPHATITTSYSSHVPRGAAAVASITPPRAAMATPIRAPHLQPASIPISSVPRCSSIRSLPVTTSIPPKPQASLMNDPLRPRGGVATVQFGAHLRPTDQIIRTSVCGVASKSVHVSQPVVSAIKQMPEKGYYKPHPSTNMSVGSSVVMPVQQHSTLVSTASTAIGAASPASHSLALTSTQLVGAKTQLRIPPPIMSVQAVHTVPPLKSQPTQQLVSVPTVTTKPSITIHGSPHLTTNLTSAVPRMTNAASIPVAKVQPLSMTTRTNLDVSESSNTVNLFVPSHHPTQTNQAPAAGSVGTASVVLMEAPHPLPTYIYETYQNTITMAPYGGPPATFSTLQPGSAIRLPSHPSQNITAAVQNASRSASVSPIMVAVEQGRSLTLHTSYSSNAETLVTTCEPIVSSVSSSIHAVNSGNYSGSQSGNCNSTSSVSSSPRPSILRKRTSEGLSVVRKNLMASMPNLEPPTSPHPDSNLNNVLLSATSPKPLSEQSRENGLNRLHEDKNIANTVIKTEPLDVADNSNNRTTNGISVETSPRKKPRKQQLTGNEMVEAHSTDAEDEFERDSRNIKKESLKHDDGVQLSTVRPRPNITLINSYRHTWKSRHNHFLHYSDVKAKEERRTNISDLANQKGMMQKLNGWKIHHLSTQLDEVVDDEDGVLKRLNDFLSRLEDCDRRDNRESNGVSELIKGNLQRCRIIRDQMKEAKQQVLKVIDHKSQILDIIGKYIAKKPLRKKDNGMCNCGYAIV
uniref:Histone deacetylase complex subunit SAP130 C-terminal domain-containing protein n=1 Tax=Strigamia maritima TaxID=126957 RepID=T1IZ24_STRMM